MGVLAAIASSALGGTAGAATRFVIADTDPVTLAAFRFGIGFLVLLPIAWAQRARMPKGRDWFGAALLGILFFGIFFVLFNLAFSFTTAGRGALALSTLPLITMLVAAALGAERLSLRKSAGVLLAMLGVAFALLADLAPTPAGAWRGDAIMIGATICMALYSIWSRPLIARSAPIPYLAAGMFFGVVSLVPVAALQGGFAAVARLDTPQWLAITYIGVVGGAASFYLWVFALQRTTPTRVTNTMTVNPVTASLVAALLIGEPIGANLVIGIVAVFAGIWIASRNPEPSRQ